MLKGSGMGAPCSIQCMKSPCLQPAAMSQSVEASPIIISIITIRPQMNAITCKGIPTISKVATATSTYISELRNYFIHIISNHSKERILQSVRELR